jgi:hypothetical protein
LGIKLDLSFLLSAFVVFAGFDWVLLLILVIIGLVVIVLIRLFLVLIPAILVALLVYFLTGGDLFWTGVAFLVVALLSLIARI